MRVTVNEKGARLHCREWNRSSQLETNKGKCHMKEVASSIEYLQREWKTEFILINRVPCDLVHVHLFNDSAVSSCCFFTELKYIFK